MDMREAVHARRSVRAFLPKPIPRDVIRSIVDTARWTPSWGNIQPWELVVADGEKLKSLADALYAEGRKAAAPRPDVTMPMEFSGVYKQRYMNVGKSLLTHMGVSREDKEARIEHYLNMYRFFGAPTVVYLCMDAQISEPYGAFDLGAIGSTLCYAAVAEGLGTILLASAAHFPNLIRQELDIPEDKKIVVGIAVGYPDPSVPAATFRSEREPVDAILKFV